MHFSFNMPEYIHLWKEISFFIFCTFAQIYLAHVSLIMLICFNIHNKFDIYAGNRVVMRMSNALRGIRIDAIWIVCTFYMYMGHYFINSYCLTKCITQWRPKFTQMHAIQWHLFISSLLFIYNKVYYFMHVGYACLWVPVLYLNRFMMI